MWRSTGSPVHHRTRTTVPRSWSNVSGLLLTHSKVSHAGATVPMSSSPYLLDRGSRNACLPDRRQQAREHGTSLQLIAGSDERHRLHVLPEAYELTTRSKAAWGTSPTAQITPRPECSGFLQKPCSNVAYVLSSMLSQTHAAARIELVDLFPCHAVGLRPSEVLPFDPWR